MKIILFSLLLCVMAAPLAAQIIGGTCSAASLSGTYATTMNGRAISGAGAFTVALQSNGIATFDGKGAVSFKLTENTNAASARPLTFSGTYTVASTCSGTITITTGGTATFIVAVYAQNKTFAMTGEDATYVYSGSGTIGPTTCITASLSGVYGFNENGYALTGTAITGVADADGIYQFDGQGNLSATYSVSTNGTLAAVTASGTYTVNSNCTGAASMTDNSNNAYSIVFSINNAQFQDFDIAAASSKLMLNGEGHSTFVNPNDGVVNVSSYAPNFTPPGSVFAVFGQNLATKQAQPSNVPLPTILLTTTVTVNGEAAPLFYVDALQIDAQMPWDVTPGWATVIVKNGTSTSAAAVFVPSTGTPGISTYGNNRAVVVNSDNITINGPSSAANVGDEVVAYFTGGGPVTAKEKNGTPAPDPETPLTATSVTVTVNGASCNVAYIGLTDGGIGLYQANFFLPNLPKGSYPLQISINGQKSNTPQVSLAN